MVGLSRPVAVSVAAEFNFAGVQRVVDVRGGFGELIAAVLFPSPWNDWGVLLDMGHAISRAHDSLAAAGVADRCELIAGDFFEAVPAGADVYLLKSVLHDWDDEQCEAILVNCAKAMSTDAQLLIARRLLVPTDWEATRADR